MKICYKLLYVIQRVENSFGEVTFWPQNLQLHMSLASHVLYPRCFCLTYITIFCSKYYYFVEVDATLKHYFEKILTFSIE